MSDTQSSAFVAMGAEYQRHRDGVRSRREECCARSATTEAGGEGEVGGMSVEDCVITI